MQDAHTPAPSQHGRARFLFAAVNRAIQRYRLRNSGRHLHQLPDQLLRDIGFTRFEIDYVMRHGRRREA